MSTGRWRGQVFMERVTFEFLDRAQKGRKKKQREGVVTLPFPELIRDVMVCFSVTIFDVWGDRWRLPVCDWGGQQSCTSKPILWICSALILPPWNKLNWREEDGCQYFTATDLHLDFFVFLVTLDRYEHISVSCRCAQELNIDLDV